MSTLVVTLGRLISMSRDPSYNWMRSLAPMRVAQRPSPQRRSGCCGGSSGGPTGSSAAEQVLTDPLFLRDLQRLKQQQKLTKIVVSAGVLNTTV